MSKNKKWKRVDKNIYTRGNGDTYWVRIACKGRPRIEQAAGRRLKDARALLVKIQNLINEGTIGTKKIPDVTFEEVAERVIEYWQEEIDHPSRPATTIRHASKLFGGVLLRDITAWDIERYKNMRRKTVKKNGQLISDTTIKKELQHLNRLFVLADRWDLVPSGHNPVKKVEKPKENEGRVPELSDEDEKRLLLACSPGIRPIVKFAIYSGLRQGEILGLTWDRVDIKGCLVYLDKTKSGKPRHVRLCQTAVNILKSLHNGSGEGHMFVNPKTERPYTKGMRHSFEKAKKEIAGIEDLTFHDLRHVFASRLRRRGASLGDIAEALGHKSITMTLRYAHLSPDYMGSVVELLDQPAKAKEKRNWDISGTPERKTKSPNP